MSRTSLFRECLRWAGVMTVALGTALACTEPGPTPTPSGEGGGGGALPSAIEPLYGEGGEAPQQLRLVFRAIPVVGLGSATDFAFLPNEGDLKKNALLMLTRENRISLVDLKSGVAEIRRSWDFADDGFIEYACAPTNVLLDPEFEDNHFIYITKCSEPETTQLLRFVFDEESGLSDRQVIFETTYLEGQEGWHRMGSMGFETDDVLWLLVGDHDDVLPNVNAQDVTNPLGALVRIIPNRELGKNGHTIPSGNFAEEPDAPEDTHPALFAYGLRSPWRGTRDSSGRYWVGDVGLRGFEEVNLIDSPGQNFGWHIEEGFCREDCEGFVDPLVVYDRSSEHPYVLAEPMAGGSELRAIWVGEIYQEVAFDRYEGLMTDVVPFGDLFVGFVRGLRVDSQSNLTMDEPIGLLPDVTTWKVGPDGYAYAADLFGNLHVALLDYAPHQ